MSFFYINEPKSKVYFNENKIICETGDLKTMLPVELLEGVVLIGNAGISTQCAKQLLRRGIPVSYISGKGDYFGRLESTRHINIKRQRCQFRCGDRDDFCIEIAIRIISAKIRNQCVILRRYNRRVKNEQVERNIIEIKEKENHLPNCKSIEQIMGYEGIASKIYFESLSYLIRSEFAFKGRNRMPPKDPFNSLLSFGYTLLLYEVYNAVTIRGLNPYAGFIHKDRQGHPALASDMMEEWRPVIVDSLVMNLLNNHIFNITDFTVNEKNNGIFIEKKAIKKFIAHFEAKLRNKSTYLSYVDYSQSFRKAIVFQAGVIGRAVEDNNPSLYQPVMLR